MKIDAIVLAGSSNNGPLREYSSVSNEALIPIGNRIMVDYVISALQNAQSIGQIVVVGPVAELKEYYKEEGEFILAPAGQTAVESFQNGLAHLNPQGHVLVTTGDIPLLKPEAVESFIAKCAPFDADVYYPIVSKEVNEKYYPGVKRTYVALKEGTFTGGNIFLVNPQIVPHCVAKGEELVQLRKSPIALSRQIGFCFVLKFLCRMLSLEETEARFSELLKLKGKAVIMDYPEIGIDVDKPSDLELVRKVLA